jgi:hypothetical protein
MSSKKYTLKMLSEDTLRKAKVPLTALEIWNKSKEYGFQDNIDSVGKTPWASIDAQIYVDIRDNPNSKFIKCQKNPVKFTLKDIVNGSVVDETEETSKKESSFYERDLHPLLSTYVSGNSHFKCYTKTIYHEKSNNDKKGRNKWLHPDIVGVYFPFDDYKSNTLKAIETFSDNAIKLFSFEMKKEIDMQHLREYFFQAVSNSSWANEGYLVALKYDSDDELINEMRRLNNSFGIGFIQLNAENVEQSEILLPAKINPTLDWETINRLAEENPDFLAFIDSINEDNQVKKVKSKYDEILSSDRMQDYVHKHKLLD